MCLIEGLADGRLLEDGSVLPERLAVEVPCGCAGGGGGVSRRGLLARSAAALGGAALAAGLGPAAAALGAEPAPAAPTGDRLVMLGLNGGPILSPVHSQPSIVLVVDGEQYMVDAGADSARQLVLAKLGFERLRHLFLTHHHIDHVAGLPGLGLLGWTYTPSQLVRLHAWGPPPLARLSRQIFHAFDHSIDLFSHGVGGTPPQRAVLPREVVLPRHGIRRVMEDRNVRVTATRVFHGTDVHDAYAYRFDLKHRRTSVVFSGDTAPNRQLEHLARDADVLVHEAAMFTALEPIIQAAAPDRRTALRGLLHSIHTDVNDLPKVAKAANVKRLVLCHYTPSFVPPAAYLAAVKAAAAKVGYGGEIIAPTELDQIAL